MMIRRIEGATRDLGAPVGWDGDLSKCRVLPVQDVTTEHGPFMVSAWEPTAEELVAMQRGESVKLWVQGVAHPVVSITVGGIP